MDTDKLYCGDCGRVIEEDEPAKRVQGRFESTYYCADCASEIPTVIVDTDLADEGDGL